MKYREVTKKELAQRLGTSQAYITKIFRGNANFTLASMTKLVQALDGKINVQVLPKEEQVQQWFKVLKPAAAESALVKDWSKSVVVETCHVDNGLEVCVG